MAKRVIKIATVEEYTYVRSTLLSFPTKHGLQFVRIVLKRYREERARQYRLWRAKNLSRAARRDGF